MKTSVVTLVSKFFLSVDDRTLGIGEANLIIARNILFASQNSGYVVTRRINSLELCFATD